MAGDSASATGATLTDLVRAARLISLALLIAVLCNGASVYMKRTGLLDREAYNNAWSVHCAPVDPDGAVVVAEPRCCANVTDAQTEMYESDAHIKLEEESLRYIFDSQGPEIGFKLVKDLFVVLLTAYCAFLVGKRIVPAPAIREAWPVFLLVGYVLISFLSSSYFNGPLFAIAGLRAFMFALLALLGLWLVPRLGDIARCVGALLVLQMPLIPWELFQGIHLHGHWLPYFLASRVSGTFVLPNSLGIFAVTALAFFYSFASNRSWVPWLCIAALAAIYYAGSGAGIICLGVLLFNMLYDRAPEKRRAHIVIGGILAGLLLVWLLPEISGREDVYGSVLEGGRLGHLVLFVAEHDRVQLLFGSGLGAGKGATLGLMNLVSPEAIDAAWLDAVQFTDSTITGLMTEIGLLGAVMFYAALVWAGRRDPAARPFYWVVVLSSLVVNITAFFPVNFLLGLAWAHSIGCARRA